MGESDAFGPCTESIVGRLSNGLTQFIENECERAMRPRKCTSSVSKRSRRSGDSPSSGGTDARSRCAASVQVTVVLRRFEARSDLRHASGVNPRSNAKRRVSSPWQARPTHRPAGGSSCGHQCVSEHPPRVPAHRELGWVKARSTSSSYAPPCGNAGEHLDGPPDAGFADGLVTSFTVTGSVSSRTGNFSMNLSSDSGRSSHDADQLGAYAG